MPPMTWKKWTTVFWVQESIGVVVGSIRATPETNAPVNAFVLVPPPLCRCHLPPLPLLGQWFLGPSPSPGWWLLKPGGQGAQSFGTLMPTWELLTVHFAFLLPRSLLPCVHPFLSTSLCSRFGLQILGVVSRCVLMGWFTLTFEMGVPQMVPESGGMSRDEK
ncbi:hypothetical protein B0H13DRAFT_1908714 [Mycena leptocephala]|nr:hypothetical protein B0H13DRAFT_1908714 [Mycena leptocephala]